MAGAVAVDGHGLLTESAGRLDMAWAESLGEFVLHYVAQWKQQD